MPVLIFVARTMKYPPSVLSPGLCFPTQLQLQIMFYLFLSVVRERLFIGLTVQNQNIDVTADFFILSVKSLFIFSV